MTMLPVVWWWLNQAATMSLFKGVLLARVSGELATANCTLLPKCQEKESKARGRELMNVSACFLLLNSGLKTDGKPRVCPGASSRVVLLGCVLVQFLETPTKRIEL